MVHNPTKIAALTISVDSTLKRIAWAFGCSKKGSEEESMLRDVLIDKVRLESESPIDPTTKT